MNVNNLKQVFINPGVYTQETNLTYVKERIGNTSLGLVGETVKGRAFEPFLITNYTDFKTFFGGTSPEKFKGNNMPKYELAYIAKEFLKEANELYVTRVLGLSGYKAGNSWGIVLNGALDTNSITQPIHSDISSDPITISITGTTENIITLTVTNDINNFVTNVYNDNQYNNVFLSFIGIINPIDLPNINETYTYNVTGSSTGMMWLRTNNDFDGYNFEYNEINVKKIDNNIYEVTVDFIGYFNSSATPNDIDGTVIALLRSRGSYNNDEILNYVTNTLNINPTYINAKYNPLGEFIITGTTNVGGNFEYKISLDNQKRSYIINVLGQTNDDTKTPVFVEKIFNTSLLSLIQENKVMGVRLELVNFGNNFNNYLQEYQPAVTPYILSEIRGNKIFKLFRFWTISDGNSANNEIKISIVNINPTTKEFDVIIRSFSDTDRNIVILEKFSKCVLDPKSSNYIGRKIGTVDGNFPTNSKYVLIEINEEDDISDAYPIGFLGYPLQSYDMISGIKNPEIRYKNNYLEYENKRRTYLGISDTVGIDSSFFNYIGLNPDGSEFTGTTKGFHLDKDANNVIVDDLGTVDFIVGPHSFQNEDDLIETQYEYLYSRKFTLVPYGGFDGWDIYRTFRTNTNEYNIFGIKGKKGLQNGNFTTYSLLNGNDGITSDYYAYLNGILTFSNPESININVFATPGINTRDNINLVNEAIEMIELQRADSIYIVTTPDVDNSNQILTVDDVVNNLEGLFDSNYTATYWPWIQIYDSENSQYIWLPPTLSVIQNIAITDRVSHPWFSIAGYDRGNVNCIQLRKILTYSEREILYKGRVNPIIKIRGEGYKIWGNKNMQIAEDVMNRLNIRRLILQARKLISVTSMKLIFDQNDDTIRNKFLELINPILNDIKEKRGLRRFEVVLSNDPEDFDRLEMNGSIFIVPTKSLEQIKLNFILTPEGAIFDNI